MFIQRFRVENFKGFEEAELRDCARINVFVGPNNSGKTNMLHAVALWHTCLRNWVSERIERKSRARKRTGVGLSREEQPVPIHSLRDLWYMRKTHLTTKDGMRSPRPKEIVLEAETTEGRLPIHIKHQAAKVIHVSYEGNKETAKRAAQAGSVLYLGPIAGLSMEEPELKRERVARLLSEGRGGEVLRNILLAVRESEQWEQFEQVVERLCGLKDLVVEQTATGTLRAFYKENSSQLEIAHLGSGTQQAIFVLASIYAFQPWLVLLDEPEAHAHPNLAREILFMFIQGEVPVNQVLLSSHSESTLRLLADTPESVALYAFFPKRPPERIPPQRHEYDRIRRALEALTVHDIALLSQVPAALFVEGENDRKILTAFAKKLDHPIYRFLNDGLLKSIGGAKSQERVKDFAWAAKAAFQGAKFVLLLDRNASGQPPVEYNEHRALTTLRWGRAEIENYLLAPKAIKTAVKNKSAGAPLFANHYLSRIDDWFSRLPEDRKMRESLLSDSPASKKLLPDLFSSLPPEARLKKSEYYRIAEAMEPDEIHPDIKEMLDRIYKELRLEEYYGELGAAL